MQVNSINFLSDQYLPQFGKAANNENSTPASVQTTANTQPDPAPANDSLSRLVSTLATHDISLKFSTDDTTREVVVEMVDENTGEAIRQIPSNVSLSLAATFIKLQGQFINRSE